MSGGKSSLFYSSLPIRLMYSILFKRPPEYTMPKTPLPTGPPPSLADLQARHELRHGLTSPEPVTSGPFASTSSSNSSPLQGLSRNPSNASTNLSRQPSTTSNRTNNQHQHQHSQTSLSRNPSLARSLAASGGASSSALSSSDHGGHGYNHGSPPEGGERGDDDLENESRQRRTDERQEARTNLMRKLSRGRLAGANAAAAIRERANASTPNSIHRPETPISAVASAPGSPGSGSLSASLTGPGGADLQRRPSLAEMLARAGSRNQARSQSPETPLPSAGHQHQQQLQQPQSSLQSPDIPTPSTSASIAPIPDSRESASAQSYPETTPSASASLNSSTSTVFSPQSHSTSSPVPSTSGRASSSMPLLSDAFSPSAASSSSVSAASITGHYSASPSSSKGSGKGKYGHIPIPPTPQSAASAATSTTSPAASYSSSSTTAGTPGALGSDARILPSHESIYSAVSNYRPYRHTMERDRDSAIARMAMEDNFEFDLNALEEARASVATHAKPSLHEKHPLSDEEEGGEDAEEDEGDQLEVVPSPRLRQNQLPLDDHEEQGPRRHAPDHFQKNKGDKRLDLNKSAVVPRVFSPPDSPLDARMIPRAPKHGNFLAPQAHNTHHLSTVSSNSSAMSLDDRSADSLPQTPTSISPNSPFMYSSMALDRGHSSDSGPDSMPRSVSVTPQPDNRAPAAAASAAAAVAPSLPTPAAESDNAVEESIENPFGFRRHHQKVSTDSFPVSVISSRASQYPASVAFVASAHLPPMPDELPPPHALQSIMKDKDVEQARMKSSTPPPLPEKDSPSSSAKKKTGAAARSATTASPSPIPGLAVLSAKTDLPVNAGPGSEYRFPYANGKSAKRDSVSASVSSLCCV